MRLSGIRRKTDGRRVAWLETKDLTPGTELVSADGDRAIVITVLKTDRIEPTYNFEVEGFHTSFVGESDAWVHNACELMSRVVNLRGKEVIARGRGIRDVRYLMERFGGKVDQWRKMKGFGELDGVTREVHWYEAQGIGKFLGKTK